jgi:ubiquinone/menaquinone biosynthesis C-methylase UbiE
MPHRFTGDFSRLESAERKNMLPTEKILQEMKIRPGDTLMDFGCGIGYFSIPALEYVGTEGKVIAVDVSDQMLQELLRRAGPRKNLIILQADTLPLLEADIILLSTVLHEVDNPNFFLETCLTRLKPHGRVIVIDWQKIDNGLMGPPVEDRLAKEEVIGFTAMKYREHFINQWIYFLEFLKD